MLWLQAARCTQAEKRHSSNMIADLKREKMENANPQKQEFGSPSLQPSLRCQTHAFFANARGLASSVRLETEDKIVFCRLITGLKMRLKG